MRNPTVSASILCLLACAAVVSGQQPQPDDARLRQRIAEHQLASERADLRGLVDIYATDAQTVSSSGKVLRGRDAIEADYRESLMSASSRSGRHHTHPPESVRIEFVTPDVALIEVDSVNVGGTDGAGAALGESRVQLITIWRKRAGEWLVVYQRAVPAPSK
jgi:uncharacterized protein (TIGR02246 family)